VALTPLGASFNPQRSWASPFRALILPGDRETLAGSSLRSGASRQNPYDRAPALQRVAPTQKAVSLVAPECLARAGTAALLSFQTSQALPLATLGRELLRLFLPLSSL
jgi:hypothetical protein